MKDAVTVRQDLSGLLRYSEKGLRLTGTPLWLEGETTQGVAFFASALQKRSTFRSVITSQETEKILLHQRIKLDRPLVCEFNHPFALGTLELELLPSGSLPGGANLWVKEPRFGSLLFTKGLCFVEDPCLGRPFQIKFADHLMIEALEPLILSGESKQTSPERFTSGLLELIQDCERSLASQRSVHLFLDVLPLGPLLLRELISRKIPTNPHPNLQKMLALYENLSFIGPDALTLGGALHEEPRVNTHSLRSLKNSFSKIPPQDLICFVSTKSSQNSLASQILSNHEKRFVYLPLGPNQEELETLIRVLKCSCLYFYGPYANQYKKEITPPQGIRKEALAPNGQSSLF